MALIIITLVFALVVFIAIATEDDGDDNTSGWNLPLE